MIRFSLENDFGARIIKMMPINVVATFAEVKAFIEEQFKLEGKPFKLRSKGERYIHDEVELQKFLSASKSYNLWVEVDNIQAEPVKIVKTERRPSKEIDKYGSIRISSENEFGARIVKLMQMENEKLSHAELSFWITEQFKLRKAFRLRAKADEYIENDAEFQEYMKKAETKSHNFWLEILNEPLKQVADNAVIRVSSENEFGARIVKIMPLTNRSTYTDLVNWVTTQFKISKGFKLRIGDEKYVSDEGEFAAYLKPNCTTFNIWIEF